MKSAIHVDQFSIKALKSDALISARSFAADWDYMNLATFARSRDTLICTGQPRWQAG
jgi:hypothetical protein